MSSFKHILTRNVNNPQMLALLIILLITFAIIYFFGTILAPVFLAVLLAYLLNFPLQFLMRKGFSRGVALTFVFSSVAVILGFIVFEVVPLLIRQISNLITEMPSITEGIRRLLSDLQMRLSPYVSEQYVYQVYENIYQWFQKTLDIRLDNILAILSSVVYISLNLFLVPFMALLILVDIKPLTEAVTKYLPQSRELASGVFYEFLRQTDNYVKGKVAEFVIMSILSFVSFMFFGLKYNIIISLVIGISVVVPYVGIIIATAPLVVVGYFQFGLTNTFWILMVVHTVLQIFNGNLLVPYLYSKANNLRPFTILVAVLFFGQIWGILGVFLAIPLTTLIKAVANAWLLNSRMYLEAQEREQQELQHRKKRKNNNTNTNNGGTVNNTANHAANYDANVDTNNGSGSTTNPATAQQRNPAATDNNIGEAQRTTTTKSPKASSCCLKTAQEKKHSHDAQPAQGTSNSQAAAESK